MQIPNTYLRSNTNTKQRSHSHVLQFPHVTFSCIMYLFILFI